MKKFLANNKYNIAVFFVFFACMVEPSFANTKQDLIGIYIEKFEACMADTKGTEQSIKDCEEFVIVEMKEEGVL